MNSVCNDDSWVRKAVSQFENLYNIILAEKKKRVIFCNIDCQTLAHVLYNYDGQCYSKWHTLFTVNIYYKIYITIHNRLFLKKLLPKFWLQFLSSYYCVSLRSVCKLCPPSYQEYNHVIKSATTSCICERHFWFYWPVFPLNNLMIKRNIFKSNIDIP